MRGFPDLPSRELMKTKFYEGELWNMSWRGILMPMLEKYEVVSWRVAQRHHIGSSGPVTAFLAGWIDGKSGKGRMRVERHSDGQWVATRKE
jgi:hypothetical protein